MEFERDPLEKKTPDISHELWGWQYTSNGRIAGIKGKVDLSINFVNRSKYKQ